MSCGVEWEVDAGDTFRVVLRIEDAGQPRDLTGSTVRGQIRKTAVDPSVAATFTVTIADLESGEITLSLSNADTLDLDPGGYVFDIKLDDSNGETEELVGGSFFVYQSVTR